jgi:hypothetical protein
MRARDIVTKDSRMVWGVHCEEFSHVEFLSLSRAHRESGRNIPKLFPRSYDTPWLSFLSLWAWPHAFQHHSSMHPPKWISTGPLELPPPFIPLAFRTLEWGRGSLRCPNWKVEASQQGFLGDSLARRRAEDFVGCGTSPNELIKCGRRPAFFLARHIELCGSGGLDYLGERRKVEWFSLLRGERRHNTQYCISAPEINIGLTGSHSRRYK